MTTTEVIVPVNVREMERRLSVVLARVRCELIHGQPNGGRCEDCIYWAERNAPKHSSGLAELVCDGGDCRSLGYLTKRLEDDGLLSDILTARLAKIADENLPGWDAGAMAAEALTVTRAALGIRP